MKLIIASSPKCGNVWVEYILKNYFNLEHVEFEKFFDSQDNIITFEHISYSRTLHKRVIDERIILITLVRNPIDLFKSHLHHIINKKNFDYFTASLANLSTINPSTLVHIFYTWFKSHVLISIGWSYFFPVLSYDLLCQNPQLAIKNLLFQLGLPVNEERLNYSLCVSQRNVLHKVANPNDIKHFIKSKLDKRTNEIINEYIVPNFLDDKLFARMNTLSNKMVVTTLPQQFNYRTLSDFEKFSFYSDGEQIDVFSTIAFYYHSFLNNKFPTTVNAEVLDEFEAFLNEKNDSFGVTLNNYLVTLLNIRTDVLKHVSEDNELNVFEFYRWILTYGIKEYGIPKKFMYVLDITAAPDM